MPDTLVHHEPAADARAERQQAEVLDFPSAAQLVLAQGGGVGVVFENHRIFEAFL